MERRNGTQRKSDEKKKRFIKKDLYRNCKIPGTLIWCTGDLLFINRIT